MTPTLEFDFQADRQKNTLTIRREFNASKELVWDCYTKSELLDQWFAPAPLTARTRSMDFRPGGHWHFALIEPGGNAFWNYIEYITVQPRVSYTSIDSFSNEAAEINHDMPRARWLVSFHDKGDNALVETVVSYDSLADLETVIQMGVKDGLASTLDRLDTLLTTFQK